MSSAPSAQEIGRDARWLAQALEPRERLVGLVRMDRDSYRAASFLDDRLFQQPQDVRVVPWPTIEQAFPAESRRDARWIFHIGHVGSTLVARLLGELPGTLSIREPKLLRDLVALSPDDRVGYMAAVQALYSRTFGPGETALVKATSFVSEIAPELVARDGRALFLLASPANYVASILAGPNSLQELGMLAGSRAQRMANRVTGLDDQKRSAAHAAAAAWACEMTSLEAAAEAMPDRRVEWADFDRMLEDMTAALTRAAALLGTSAAADQIAAVAAGPLMGRYSKGLEYEYSPTLRRDLIAEATARHRRDIESALAMLARASERSPLLARSLARAEEP